MTTSRPTGTRAAPAVVQARAELLAALPAAPAEQLAADAELDATLEAALARVAAAWPWYQVDGSLFALVAAGLDEGEASASVLAHRRWEDLALLSAFRGGHPEAAGVVNSVLVPHVAAVVRARGAAADVADDLVQDWLCRLLGPIEAVKYSGRGHLGAWLRQCVLHDWIDAARKASDVSLEAIDLDAYAAELVDLEADTVAARFRPHFRAAVTAAVATLAERDRTLLRLVHVDGLTARQAAAVLGVHRVSLQRRLGVVRRSLRTEVIAQLDGRFQLGAGAASSVLRAFAGRLDQTLTRLLVAPGDTE